MGWILWLYNTTTLFKRGGREKGTTLPNDLVNYLTKVSSEFFISGYPTQFHLSSIPDKNTCDKINIPITRNCFFDKDFYYIEDDNDVNINEKPVDKTNQFEVEDFSNCMYKISEIGCAFSYNIYLGSGEMNGSVWYYGDDNYWGLTATSLTNFIIENFHKC